MQELWEGLHHWLSGLLAWVESFAESPYSTQALFAFAFAESSFFPVPPDVLLIALALGQPERAFWYAAVCTVGSVLGGMCGYGIGYFGGRPVLKRLIADETVEAVEWLYDRYTAWGGTFRTAARSFFPALHGLRGIEQPTHRGNVDARWREQLLERGRERSCVADQPREEPEGEALSDHRGVDQRPA